jgi:ABC-type transporter Mla subunit MlaD
LNSGIDGALIRDVLVGIAALLAGIGIFLACRGLAGLFTRLNTTLDEVDRQIEAVSGPVVDTLKHVGGIANTADTTVAHLGGVVGKLEGIAAAASRTAKLASDAVAPALVNIGSTLTGITAGVQRLFGKRRGPSPDSGLNTDGG